MDPILAYLLEFNEKNAIEYKGRYLIPPGGLAEMLNDFKKFHLNREEVVVPVIEWPPKSWARPETTIEELYKLLD